eukprot:TRINITY_DN106759_c0_g1_i1.p1 TRINITY_DN106759_c0_g1~~TRINITY_DN106759_c0_g1_i1.p1  ORF type:complete len:191 (-),score=48.34 TRINITY_DN106759_c0_g1_i1:96-668(-)
MKSRGDPALPSLGRRSAGNVLLSPGLRRLSPLDSIVRDFTAATASAQAVAVTSRSSISGAAAAGRTVQHRQAGRALATLASAAVPSPAISAGVVARQSRHGKEPPDEALTAQIYDALQQGASAQAESLFGQLDHLLRRQDLHEAHNRQLEEDAALVRMLPDEIGSDDSDLDGAARRGRRPVRNDRQQQQR